MPELKLGELAALGTAVFWTVTAMSFEHAGKRVGTLSLNLIRLCMGFVFIGLYSLVTRGFFLPTDAEASAWLWLSLSGLVGFVIGDLLLFQAFIEIGARISMLVYASVPPLTGIIGYFFLGEVLGTLSLAGMALTISGIALVVLQRGGAESAPAGGVRFAHPVRGILYAFGGALGQAVGLILGKYGAGSYDAFSGTQIRVIAGAVGFGVVIAAARRLPNVVAALTDRRALASMTLGSFFGPFLGVSLSLLAVQLTSTGVASTIMAVTPVLIIPAAVVLFKERVNAKEIFGALLAVSGVAVLFLT